MKKKAIITTAIVAALVLSAGCVTAFAAGVDAETNEPKSSEAVVASENDEETQTESSATEQSEYSYITGQQRSTERNDLYAQAEELPEDEQDAFLAKNGIGDTPYSEEAAASYSYVGGQRRGASYRQSDDSERTQDTSDYGYITGQQRGASYHK